MTSQEAIQQGITEIDFREPTPESTKAESERIRQHFDDYMAVLMGR